MPIPRVAVVIPAYCEEQLIRATIDGLPESVSHIIVVDDASEDATQAQALSSPDPRLTVLRHNTNRGVGAAIYTGYREALKGTASIFVVMAGDNQMDTSDLYRLVAPLQDGSSDYVKGNRLAHRLSHEMPFFRRLGTRVLAVLTSKAAGIAISDSQCGYTAISRNAAKQLNWKRLWPRYGYPNDLLIALVRAGARVSEVPVRPVYATEKSGLRPWHLISIMGVIVRRCWMERRNASLAPEALLKESSELKQESI